MTLRVNSDKCMNLVIFVHSLQHELQYALHNECKAETPTQLIEWGFLLVSPTRSKSKNTNLIFFSFSKGILRFFFFFFNLERL